MWWALAVLLAFLSPASQKSSNLEGRTKSVTRPTGSSAEITCDLPGESTVYIHWYLHQEGKAPQRLLYYDYYNSRVVLESGISPGKYDTYGSTRKNLRLILRNLIENDSGVYYCATWDG
ncbi:TRGV4 isoform 1, partial [Pongo abelii]